MSEDFCWYVLSHSGFPNLEFLKIYCSDSVPASSKLPFSSIAASIGPLDSRPALCEFHLWNCQGDDPSLFDCLSNIEKLVIGNSFFMSGVFEKMIKNLFQGQSYKQLCKGLRLIRQTVWLWPLKKTLINLRNSASSRVKLQ